MKARPLPSSFRDPSGFLFRRDGVLLRQINHSYREHYEELVSSGLYERLVGKGLLVPHQGTDQPPADDGTAYKVIQPEEVPFISYPYEWSFSQLKDAGLATLSIQQEALASGMSLKDASAFNIQFRGCRPILIDTLSFERYREGRPWVAYRQFCQHFLAPLALASHRDERLPQLLRIHLDGIPLDLAAKLLRGRARLRPSIFTHIHLHARSQRSFGGSGRDLTAVKVSRRGLLGLLDSLRSAVEGCRWRPAGTEWDDYYQDTNYSAEAFEHKRQLVAEFLDEARPASVWDLGANTGRFSRLASERGIPTVAFDLDPAAVEKNYLECRREGEEHLLPLLLDLTNPSPAIGWALEERMSLLDRRLPDVALALALVHHLAIGNNLPLENVALFMSRLCRVLILEFVPKEDSQVQRMLASREDIFPTYHRSGFEEAFGRHFQIRRRERISGSKRTLYWLESRRQHPSVAGPLSAPGSAAAVEPSPS